MKKQPSKESLKNKVMGIFGLGTPRLPGKQSETKPSEVIITTDIIKELQPDCGLSNHVHTMNTMSQNQSAQTPDSFSQDVFNQLLDMLDQSAIHSVQPIELNFKKKKRTINKGVEGNGKHQIGSDACASAFRLVQHIKQLTQLGSGEMFFAFLVAPETPNQSREFFWLKRSRFLVSWQPDSIPQT